jgi:acetyltransferase
MRKGSGSSARGAVAQKTSSMSSVQRSMAHIVIARRAVQSSVMSQIFATTARLPDGTEVELRPIRPEDETLLQDIARHMTAEDLRRRFFASMPMLPHNLAAQLSHIDYDRAMALVARTADGMTGLGAARFIAEPGNARAEFALGVRSDWHGRGLGRLLLGRIVDIAAARGVGELYGDVLHDNEPMIGLARAMGFSLETHPNDAALLRVVRSLVCVPS